MSATVVSTGTTVRARARCITVVANELINIGLKITHHYRLAHGSFTNNLEILLKGVRVWLAAQQLESLVIEIFNKNDRMLLKWELPIDYSESDQNEDEYETRMDELEAFLAKHRPPNLSRYRVLASFRTDTHIPVPGWKPTRLTNDSHLKRQQVSSNVVKTKYARSALFVFSDSEDATGEEP